MNNATRILDTLDHHMKSQIELTLYGRAALTLGFKDPPEDFARSHDIDAVLWLGQAEDLNERTNFWEAVEKTNAELADQELYISHFFTEDQVILQPGWRDNRIRIAGPWRNLIIHRLGNVDLLLTKLMRYDPLDHADARFIAARAKLTRAEIEDAIRSARIPDSPEIREQLRLSSQKLLDSM